MGSRNCQTIQHHGPRKKVDNLQGSISEAQSQGSDRPDPTGKFPFGYAPSSGIVQTLKYVASWSTGSVLSQSNRRSSFAELDRLETTTRPIMPAVRLSTMKSLFDPWVSERRALLLALGTYNPASLPAANRQGLIAQVSKLYSTDPDPGIHGAAEWTLAALGANGLARDGKRQLAAGQTTVRRGWLIIPTVKRLP